MNLTNSLAALAPIRCAVAALAARPQHPKPVAARAPRPQVTREELTRLFASQLAPAPRR